MNNLIITPFYVKDCALASIATGINARSLIELKDKLSLVPSSSIYYHFWGGRLRTSFEHREYHNDFSSWAHDHLHDDILAERLELLNPHEFENIEDLRTELIEIIDDRLDEREIVPWVRKENKFHFVKYKIVIFQTRHQINTPNELVQVIPLLTRSSLFYHMIDAALRTPDHTDDFSQWLSQYQDKYQILINAIKRVDPYLISLKDLQSKLYDITSAFFDEG